MWAVALFAVTVAQGAEVVPWAQVDEVGPGAVYATTGLDDAFTVGVGYRHVSALWGDRSLVLAATAEVPWAAFDLADHRVLFAASMPLIQHKRWVLAGRVAPTWRRVETQMNTMGAAGLDAGVVGGWTSSRWFVSGLLGVETALATRIVHAEVYREMVYTDAVDGWYRITGARLTGELQVGAAFDRTEVALRLGQARDLRLQTGTIPAFATVNVGWRL